MLVNSSSPPLRLIKVKDNRVSTGTDTICEAPKKVLLSLLLLVPTRHLAIINFHLNFIDVWRCQPKLPIHIILNYCWLAVRTWFRGLRRVEMSKFFNRWDINDSIDTSNKFRLWSSALQANARSNDVEMIIIIATTHWQVVSELGKSAKCFPTRVAFRTKLEETSWEVWQTINHIFLPSMKWFNPPMLKNRIEMRTAVYFWKLRKLNISTEKEERIFERDVYIWKLWCFQIWLVSHYIW